MVWATDSIGLSTLLGSDLISSPLKCYSKDITWKSDTDRDEFIVRHELGLSFSILTAGFNIASLQYSYYGWDFRLFLTSDVSFDMCNRGKDPLDDGSYFGGSLHPLETVFVKTSRSSVPLSDLEFYTRLSSKREDINTVSNSNDLTRTGELANLINNFYKSGGATVGNI